MLQESKMEERKCCNINRKYVPIKAHYFFLFGGMGGTLPYMQVFAKDFGISPTAVGIIYTIVPLFVCLSKPAFGVITDKLQNIKTIILPLLFCTAGAFFAMLFIPPIIESKVGPIEVSAICKEDRNELIITPPTYDTLCTKEIMNKQFDCELVSDACFQNNSQKGSLDITDILPVNESISLAFTFRMHKKYLYKDACYCLKENASYLVCDSNFYKCSSFQNAESPSEYKMYNFWIFVLLSVISGAGAATAFCLTDTACYEILSDDPGQYGRQRLWATISWGITTLVSGYLNDVVTGSSKDPNYSPGFYLMLGCIAIDILILYSLRLEKTKISTSISKDIRTIFSSLRTVTFSLGIYICGALTGLIWTYQFWYLIELGSSQLLLGITSAVQCLVAEVPFFFFSGWFVKKFGHFYCLITSLAAFALRIGLYSILENPWFVLPIELLHGFTYAIFCAAMTLYAVECAPPGTEATMMGIFGGIFEGLGLATGSLLGGLGFDNMGGRWTFYIASMVSLCCVPLFTIAYKVLPKSEAILELDWDSTFYTNEFPNYGTHQNNSKL